MSEEKIAELTRQRDELAAALEKARQTLVGVVRYGRDVEFINRTLRETACPDPAGILAAREKPLREALLFVKQWFLNLEDGTRPEDPLRAIRSRVHAPVHATIDEALAAVPLDPE